MDTSKDFRIVKRWNNKTDFITDKITITVTEYSYDNGKHRIAEPKLANAFFVCHGARYKVSNDDGISSIEDWYRAVLLPKMQMLSLLMD